MISRFSLALRPVAIGLALLAFAGCSDDDEGPAGTNGGTTTYEGTLVGLGDSGSLVITVENPGKAARLAAAAPGDVAGQLQLVGGCDVDLTGTVDSGVIGIEGTGPCGDYSLAGTISSDRIEGTFAGPSGRTGTFVVIEQATSNASDVFCGVWTEMEEGTPTGESGPFNLVISGSSLEGVAYDGDGDPIPLEGTVDGDQVTIFVADTPTQIASGVLDGDTISGQYNTGASAGVWSGSPCQ